MKYTKEKLQSMSDFEVNKALCTILGKDVSGVDEQRNIMTGAVTDYCDKYSAIMPLAFEHKISIFAYQDATLWVAQHYFDAIGMNSVICENPLRAIACCLILVLEGERG